MTEMLAEAAQSVTASAGEFGKALAGKTGTTQHPTVEGEARDTWFVGFTPEYVSALWMGYDKTDDHHYLTGGSSYPTRLTKDILTEIDKVKPLEEQIVKPEGKEELPKPIEMSSIYNVQATYTFIGLLFHNRNL